MLRRTAAFAVQQREWERLFAFRQAIGPDERVTPYDAMQAITIWGAEQFGEQTTKGSLKEGKSVWVRN
jgi:predicted amidohydrolase YtcJ